MVGGARLRDIEGKEGAGASENICIDWNFVDLILSPKGSRTPGMMLSNWSMRSSLSFLPPRPYSNSSSSLSLYGSNRLDLRKRDDNVCFQCSLDPSPAELPSNVAEVLDVGPGYARQLLLPPTLTLNRQRVETAPRSPRGLLLLLSAARPRAWVDRFYT